MPTNTGPVETPPARTIGDWLQSIGLGRFRDLFAAQEIDDETLSEITETDLEGWGVPFGARKRLMRAIAERADATRPSSSRPTGNEGVERRQITAMFCDMVGSTELAARLDPEDLRAVTRSYLEICRVAIEALGGHVTVGGVTSLISSLFTWAGKAGDVPRGTNPARDVTRFREQARQRYLSDDEIAKLGAALVIAETEGLPFDVDEDNPNSKHTARKIQAVRELTVPQLTVG